MNDGIIFWMTVFAISALCYFAVAAVVTVTGWRDIRHLLRRRPKDE